MHDHHAAQPFDLGAYAKAAAGSITNFARDFDLSIYAVRQWCTAKLVPWSLFEAARMRYGTKGFGTPPRVRRPRPFRLPHTFGLPPLPTPKLYKPVTPPDALLALAEAWETELKTTHGRLEAIEQHQMIMEAALLALSAPKAVQARSTPAESIPAPSPKQTRLEQILKAQNGRSTNWVYTNRAEHDFKNLARDVQGHFEKLLKELLLTPELE